MTTSASRSLGDALRGHSNALGLIRLILAVLVLVDHANPLGGFGGDIGLNHTRGQANLGSLAVAGFFAISGYLIAKSGMSSDVVQFMWRRVLRLFPAFLVALLVSAFIVGPIIWVLEGHELWSYFAFTPGSPWSYLQRNWTLSVGQWGIRDIFASDTPYGQAVGGSVFNGSIWTLIYEWRCYLIIGVLVAFAVLARARIIVPILTGLLFIAQIEQQVSPGGMANVLPILGDGWQVTLTLIFLVGSTFAVYSKSVPFDHRLGILAGLVLVGTLRFGGFATLGTVAGVYFILYLGAALPKPFHRVGQVNDFSYGIYVYGFLVQQVLAFFGVNRFGYFPFLLFSIVATAALAWVSWHAVEKPAMRLKDVGPGRGIVYWWATSNAALARLRRPASTKPAAEPEREHSPQSDDAVPTT